MEAATRRKLFVRGALGLLVTAAFFLLLWRFIDWPKLVALMRRAQPATLVSAFLLYLALYAVRAYRFQLMAPRTPYKTMYLITCVHNLLLRMLPMRMGDLSYAILVKRAGTAGLGHGVISLLLVRVFDAGAVVVLFGATLAFNRGVYRGDPMVGFVAAGVVLVLGLLSVIFFRRLLGFGLTIVTGLARLLRMDRRPRGERLLGRLSEAVGSFAETPASLMGQLAVTTAVQWLLNFANIFAIMRAFLVPVSIAQAILGGTASVVSGFLPIGGIGSFGTLEAGWTLGFTLVGLETSVAVASAFGFSIVTLGFASLLGLAGWIGLGWVGRNVARRSGAGPEAGSEWSKS